MARNKFGDRANYWLRRPVYVARWWRFRHLTMVKRRGYADNLYLADHAVRVAGLADGCVIECGTWAGGMSFGLMSTLRQIKEFHFFDSFEGLPPATEEDGERALKARELGILKHDGNTAAYEPFVANAERFRAPLTAWTCCPSGSTPSGESHSSMVSRHARGSIARSICSGFRRRSPKLRCSPNRSVSRKKG